MTNATVVGGTLKLILILLTLTLAACEDPRTPLQRWQGMMAKRCNAYAGRVEFDGNKATCIRTPFMRFPKKMFTEEFQ